MTFDETKLQAFSQSQESKLRIKLQRYPSRVRKPIAFCTPRAVTQIPLSEGEILLKTYIQQKSQIKDFLGTRIFEIFAKVNQQALDQELKTDESCKN